MTAVSIMQLVEKRKIGLDDDLGKAIPQLLDIDVLKSFDDDGKLIMEGKKQANDLVVVP